MKQQQDRESWFWTITVALIAFTTLMTMEALVKPGAPRGLYLQEWSSETMMQTVPIQDLYQTPLHSLTNIHIQPPLFDFVRTILASALGSGYIGQTAEAVDAGLYILWAVSYGAMAALLFLWLRQLTNQEFAIVAALLFTLHPASIFYASFLETTFLSSLMILWMYYLLWRLKEEMKPSTLWLFGLAALLLFFTRSVFQWPSLLVFGVALLLIGIDKKRVLIFLLVTGSVSGLYLVKQNQQFGILSTSSFTGFNLVNSVGIGDSATFWGHLSTLPPAETSHPDVLTRRSTATGQPNFNHASYLEVNQLLLERYRQHMKNTPWSELAINYWGSLKIYLRPSSTYTQHLIVDRLPWRRLYDKIFSAPVLPVLCLLAMIQWLSMNWQRDKLWPTLGLLLPGLFIFAVTVLFEKGENARLKYFLEPLLFLFIATQIYHFTVRMGERIRLYPTVLAWSRKKGTSYPFKAE